nr:transposase [Streptococcus mitis]
MLVSALLFACSQGIISGRKIEKMMLENLAMQYLTGELVVSYRTINSHYQETWLEEDNTSWFQTYSCYLDD